MATDATIETTRRRHLKVPDSLIYEVLGRRTLYYKGYKDVVTGLKTPEDIMGCSDIQALVVSTLHGHLYGLIDRKTYWLTTNESGLTIPEVGRLANDIAIFNRESIPELRGKYFRTPPKVVIEVDVKADISLDVYPAGEQDYVFDKTDKLLDFGVERVIWFTTKSKKTFIATKGEKWVVQTWDDDVLIMDGCVLNLTQLLHEEGILF
ncbi:MAG: Uma2 family endonuclease [Spirosoma sp.]|nr:Uma2 family endonuclease [Spirosoma sp.]